MNEMNAEHDIHLKLCTGFINVNVFFAGIRIKNSFFSCIIDINVLN